MKKKLLRIFANASVFALSFVATIVIAATTADNLMGLGMSPQLSEYINNNLIGVNSSGNLVLPVASGKKLSVTVAGTEELSVDGTNITAPTNNIVATAGNISATAGSLAAGTTVTGGTGVTATTGNVTATAGALSGLRLTSAAGAGFEAIASAGSTTSDAGALTVTKGFHQVTGADGVKGVKVGSMVAGDIHVLLNTTAAVLKVYAPTGGTVNGAGADVAFSALTGIKPIICVATSTTALICS